MGRRAKAAKKAGAQAKRPRARKAPTKDAARLRDLEKRLTTALDQQMATSEILRVISRSQTDIQPVFDAIVQSAVRLLHGYTGGLTRVSGDQIELVASTSIDTAGDEVLRSSFPRPLHSEGTHALAMRAGAP